MSTDFRSRARHRVWAKRSRRARWFLASIGATVFVVSLALSLSVGFVEHSAAGGVRSVLSSANATDRSAVLSATLARNAGAQDAGVRRTIARTFHGAPLGVIRSVKRVDGRSLVRWTIRPSAARTSPKDLPVLRKGFAAIEDAVISSRDAHSPDALLSGSVGATVTAIERSEGALAAIGPIPETVLALAGLVALMLARSLLTSSRQNETQLLRSRGGTVRRITRLDARESAIVCAAGAVSGAIVAQFALLLSVGPPASAVTILLPPALVFASALAVNVVLSWRAARGPASAPRAASGRRRVTMPLTLTGFGLAVTAIALWRFTQNGSDGSTFASDPSAVFAPGALLLAGTGLSLLVAGRITALIEGRARGRALSLFPIRAVNRQVALVVGPVSLLVLAISISIVTAGYIGTNGQFAADSARLTTGGDLRATLPASPVIDGPSDLIDSRRFVRLTGVTSAALASRQQGQFGDAAVEIVAVRASALPRLMGQASTSVDSRSIVRDLGSTGIPGLTLPVAATAVQIRARATGAIDSRSIKTGDRATVTLWLGDSDGDLFPADLGSIPVTAPGTASSTLATTLPRVTGAWTIEALDIGVIAPQSIRDFSFAMTSVTATASGATHAIGISPTVAWAAQDRVFNDGVSTAGAGAQAGFGRPTIAASSVGSLEVRLMTKGPSTVPIVLSRPFASNNRLVLGSRVVVDDQWSSFTGVVTGIVAASPGSTSPDVVLANLPTLQTGRLRTSEQLPAPNELWMTSRDPAASTAAVHTAVPSATVSTAGASGGAQVIQGAIAGLWIGTVGTSILAGIALAAAIIAMLFRRVTEIRVLRALGVSASRQVSFRRRELGIMLGVAATAGLLVGIVVSWLVVGTMAKLSTPTAPQTLSPAFALDPVPVIVALLLLAVCCVGCELGYAARVARQSEGLS